MSTYVLSDLHLQEAEEDFLFNRNKEKIFGLLASHVLGEQDSQLVLAGDTFDLTSMTPPLKGLNEFFVEATGRSLETPPKSREPHEMIQGIEKIYPKFFKALADLARKKKLVWIPGNHDCLLFDKKVQDEIEELLNVPVGSVTWAESIMADGHYIASHGHEFDRPNNTDLGCLNPGWAITSALYCGVVPALKTMGVNHRVADAVPAVRPEEEIVLGISDYLGDEEARKLLLAFVKLLERNGYFRGVMKWPMGFLVKQFPVFSFLARSLVSPWTVRKLLPSEESLKKMGRKGARQLRKKLGEKYKDALIILGHTHEVDFDSGYLNTGTWIDHVRGLSKIALEESDKRLPFLIIDNGQSPAVSLRDARDLKRGLQPRECAIIFAQE